MSACRTAWMNRWPCSERLSATLGSPTHRLFSLWTKRICLKKKLWRLTSPTTFPTSMVSKSRAFDEICSKILILVHPSGPKCDHIAAKDYILKKYLKENPDPDKTCYSHFTVATGNHAAFIKDHQLCNFWIFFVHFRYREHKTRVLRCKRYNHAG